MANDLLIDSSVAAKWFLPEPDSPEAKQLMHNVSAAGGKLIVLDLAKVEITNAIWKYQHRKQITSNEATRLFLQLLRTPVATEAAETSLREGFEIAARYDRSVYDAVFVATARRLGLKGVTSDEPLYNAVRQDFPEILLLKQLPIAGRAP